MSPLADAGEVAHRLSETEVIAYVLVDLAVIVAAARLVGWVFVRLQHPRIVGEIVAGILLGPTLLGGPFVIGFMTGPLFDRFAPRVPDAEAVSVQ